MHSAAGLFAMLGWDGVLPIVVASGPILVSAFLPRGHIAEVLAVVVVPIVAALVRAGAGQRQIARACGGCVPAWRQAALAIAIVLLLLFETLAAALACADDGPGDTWIVVVSFYAGYLAALYLALWRTAEPRPVAEE